MKCYTPLSTEATCSIGIGDPEYLHLYFKLWNGWLGAIIWWETGIFFTFVENDLNQWKGSAIIDYNNNMYVKLVLKYSKIEPEPA